jgi:hypothetical protein
MFSDVRQVRDSNTCQEEEDVQIVSDDANRWWIKYMWIWGESDEEPKLFLSLLTIAKFNSVRPIGFCKSPIMKRELQKVLCTLLCFVPYQISSTNFLELVHLFESVWCYDFIDAFVSSALQSLWLSSSQIQELSYADGGMTVNGIVVPQQGFNVFASVTQAGAMHYACSRLMQTIALLS